MECDPPSLAGEAILIEGLLGTQTDLAFSLTMLDGREGGSGGGGFSGGGGGQMDRDDDRYDSGPSSGASRDLDDEIPF